MRAKLRRNGGRELIGEQLGAYAIQSELGSGGMGKVYLAEAVEAVAGLEPGTKVALKVVHPHLLETRGVFKRFMQEAELGKRVRHENVVRTIDADAFIESRPRTKDPDAM